MLKEDPIIGIDYLKIINLIRRKKLVEATSDEFNPADSIDSTFLDLDLIDKEKRLKQMKDEEKFKKDMQIDAASTTGERLQLEDQETENTVRTAKKREERDKTRLLKQFDALAVQFEKSAAAI